MNAPAAPFDTDQVMFEGEPERTSIAGILSLVLGLIGCCTFVTAPIGLLLAIVGIVGISRSRGRVGGMGFAIAGLIISLLSCMLWLGALLGFRGLIGQMDQHVSKPTAQIFLDIQSDNFDGARSAMIPPASNRTDAELAAFHAAYSSTLGELVSTPNGFGEYLSGWMSLGQNLQTLQGRNDFIPIPMVFDNGTGLVVLVFDPTNQNQQMPVPLDLIVFDAQGNEYQLSDFDSSASAAQPADSDADADADADADPDSGDTGP